MALRPVHLAAALMLLALATRPPLSAVAQSSDEVGSFGPTATVASCVWEFPIEVAIPAGAKQVVVTIVTGSANNNLGLDWAVNNLPTGPSINGPDLPIPWNSTRTQVYDITTGATALGIQHKVYFGSCGAGHIGNVTYSGTFYSTPAPAVRPSPAGTEDRPPVQDASTSRDPVHTFTGAYSYTHTDIAIAGRGPSIVFSRSYESNDTRSGVLGQAWVHSYEVQINRIAQTSGNLILVGPMGRSDLFTVSGGVYTAPAGVLTKLVQNANGTYTSTHPDQAVWEFDRAGRLSSVKDRYGNTSSLTYDASGQLTAISDPAGRGSLSLGYDAGGRLASVSDWLSPARAISYGYDANGRLSTATDREGKTTSYAYDGTSHRLATITDARNDVAVTNTYDAQGRVATQKDAKGLLTGQQTTFQFDTPTAGTTTITYPATSFDPAWTFKVEDTYDGSGRIIKHVNKPSSTETFTEEYTYDANGFRSSVKDARLNTTNFCYDVSYSGGAVSGSRGNLTRRIDPPPTVGANRPVTLFQYDAKNNLVQTVPPRGVSSGTTVDCTTSFAGAETSVYRTDLAYDTATQTKLESVTRRFTDPELGLQTAVTKFEYDANHPGLVSKTIPPRGNTGGSPDYSYATSFAYFANGDANKRAGLLESVTDPLTNKTTYDYDQVGRRTKMVDPNGNAVGGVPADHTWEYSYDNEDRLRFVKAPPPVSGGSQLMTEFRYDVVGNRTVVLDANGQVTKYLYDERDSLKEVQQSPDAWTNPDANPPGLLIKAEYQYDNLGNLSRVTRDKLAADERALDYAYDGLNRLRRETQYPNWPTTTPTLLTTYAYDGNGNRTSLVDPLSQSTAFGYDNLNRLGSIDYSDPGTPDAQYTYDPNGNRLSMADGTGASSYVYDELDRLTSGTSPGPKTVGYRYDLDGNRTKVIYPFAAPNTVTYSFDKASRLTSLLDWGNRTISYEYKPDGSLKLATNPNATTAEYLYDNALRLTQLWNKQAANTVSRHTFTLDQVGNRTRIDEVLSQLGAPGPIASAPFGGALAVGGERWEVGSRGDVLTSSNLQPSTSNLAALASSLAPLSQLVPPTPTPTSILQPSTATPTATPTASATSTASVAATPTPVASSLTPTPTLTPTLTPAASSPTPTPTPTATPTPTTAAAAPTPSLQPATSNLQPLPFTDQSLDATQPYLYRAQSGAYTAELFDRATGAAGVRLSHLDTGTSLSLGLPGPALSRTAAGATASAQVGGITITWTSYADRLKEELRLAARPPADQVVFTLAASGLSFVPDGAGGYFAQTGEGLPVFQLLAPTVHDALGRVGAATLTIRGGTATVALDTAFLSTAVYPLTVDPTVVYTGGSAEATAFNNSPRLLQDSFGKLLLVSVNSAGAVVPSWSNNGGAAWSTGGGQASGVSAPTWALGPDGKLHSAYRDSTGLIYRRWSITRDASNNVTAVSPDGAAVTLHTSPDARQPSLVMDKNGQPAVAWHFRTTGGGAHWEVRFLRATGDPTVVGNWKNATGASTSPDVLGVQTGSNIVGSASLSRMQAGSPPGPNDDALYLFWADDRSDQLWWSKAQVSGANYTAWSAPTTKGPAVAGTARLATASDARNRGIVVAYHHSPGGANRVYRKGQDDTETWLVQLASEAGTEVSVGVDRGDLYLFWRNGSGNLAYRRYLPELGLDSSDTVVDSGTKNHHPTARRDLSDGQADMAWTRTAAGNQQEVRHHRFTVARPVVKSLTASPTAFAPLATPPETTTISYSLADDVAGNLTVSVKVYDSASTLVRTLVNNASQPQGVVQNVVWDGKNDGGAVQPPGVYTVKVTASDGTLTGEASTTASIETATLYTYDKLYRLTGVTPLPGTPTTYGYDHVGNRLTKGSTTYAYDKADRITSAGAVSYSVNANGNLTTRGTDTFTYDQANRLKTFNTPAATYIYDGDGKRASKTVAAVTTNYVYDVNRSLPVVLDDGSRKYVWGLGLAYAVDTAGNIEVYHTDGLGSVRAMTDSTPNVIQTYTTDEFGVPTLTQGANPQPFTYTGEQRDPETALIYLRARMYDPGIGRFVQRDPFLGFRTAPVSLNRYAYGLANPVRNTDPSGLEPVAIAGRRPIDTECLSTASGTFGGYVVNAACLETPLLAKLPVILMTNSGPVLVVGIAQMAPPRDRGHGNDPDYEREVLERQGGRFTSNEKEVQRVLRLTSVELGRAIHAIKQDIEGNPNLRFHLPSGDLYDPRSGDYLGNILDELGRFSR